MTSQARVIASRANGKRSRGPVSEEGKATSARNSLKHGLLARIASLPESEQREFAVLLRALEEYWEPSGVQEDLLVVDIAVGTFQQRRALQLECELFAAGAQGRLEDDQTGELAAAFTRSSPMLERLLRYVTAAEKRATKAIDRLMALQEARGRRRTAESPLGADVPDGEREDTDA